MIDNKKSETNLSAELEKHANPDVKFNLNPEWDYHKIFAVLSGTGFTNVPKEIVTSSYPELGQLGEISTQELEEKIQTYVSDIYKKHWGEYQDIVKIIKYDWDEYSDTFFQVANEIFKDTRWPHGEYWGSLSICFPYPRNLEFKTFQIPLKDKKYRLPTVAHEMLHFIFYEYVRKRYLSNEVDISEKMNQLMEGKFIFPLWSISEIFNMIVLSGKEFGDGQMDELREHPELQEDKKKLALIWTGVNGNIDDFFSRLEIK